MYLSDEKNNIVFFLFDFLNDKLLGQEKEFIVNGREYKGTINQVEIDDEKLEWIKFHIEDEIIMIPFNNDSKVRLDKGLYFFETDTHTTLIYI